MYPPFLLWSIATNAVGFRSALLQLEQPEIPYCSPLPAASPCNTLPRIRNAHRICVSESGTFIMTSSIHTSKRAANVSVNGVLLQKAKALKINLSATLESALSDVVRARERELWKRENQSAIDAYNRLVEKQGTFGDNTRTF
jgi:antitoxin CcdA